MTPKEEMLMISQRRVDEIISHLSHKILAWQKKFLIEHSKRFYKYSPKAKYMVHWDTYHERIKRAKNREELEEAFNFAFFGGKDEFDKIMQVAL